MDSTALQRQCRVITPCDGQSGPTVLSRYSATYAGTRNRSALLARQTPRRLCRRIGDGVVSSCLRRRAARAPRSFGSPGSRAGSSSAARGGRNRLGRSPPLSIPRSPPPPSVPVGVLGISSTRLSTACCDCCRGRPRIRVALLDSGGSNAYLKRLAGPDGSAACAGVAQLVRAPACHAGGRGFKSRHSRHSFPEIRNAISEPRAYSGSRTWKLTV